MENWIPTKVGMTVVDGMTTLYGITIIDGLREGHLNFS